ncbi:MAG: 16S rRNA (uracil(1498)-N(3))-methyltransferase, partial [Clostridiales bacterium]|nr:16S rRNA (uracil(1498)-N(3))-methyltransferase [Clostridiales bacterium]
LVSDGLGLDYDCAITRIDPKKSEVVLEIKSSCQNKTEPRLKAIVCQAIAKGDKLEYAVQKCVELGAFEIWPIVTERTVLKELSQSKLDRLRSVSESAAKQSMRGIVPFVSPAMSLKQAILKALTLQAAFAAYESEKRLGIKAYLGSLPRDVGSICFFVGPEGGFSQKEVGLFEENGISCASLGARILRSETAPLAALTAIFYEFGELGLGDEPANAR